MTVATVEIHSHSSLPLCHMFKDIKKKKKDDALEPSVHVDFLNFRSNSFRDSLFAIIFSRFYHFFSNQVKGKSVEKLQR